MDTTLRLDDSVRQGSSDGRLAIHWLTAGAPSRYQFIDEARTTVGRGPEVTVTFDATGLSRCHVEIYRQGPAYIAHDLGSTNGTHVNGKRVEYAPLSEGDVLRLGDVVGVIARVAPDVPLDGPDLDVLAPGLAFGPGLAPQLAQLRRVAPSELPVVIVGETGSGKEYVAQAVHLLSGRRGRFHPVNCAALPSALAEAELFGHSRGAFTGAEQAGLGHIRAAADGTLFLDELPDLPAPVQAKVLRVLQDRQVTPLGETRAHAVNVRVVVACQRPLDQLIMGGQLRADLAARVAGFTVAVTPLRERRADIGIFFRHFLACYGNGAPTPQVDARLLESLLLYPWPGNLRELDLLTRRLLALHGHEPTLRRSFLPPEIQSQLPSGRESGQESGLESGAGAALPAGSRAPVDRDQYDRDRLGEALRRNGGNVTRAAAIAGISRARAYRLMGDRSVEQFLAELALVRTDR